MRIYDQKHLSLINSYIISFLFILDSQEQMILPSMHIMEKVKEQKQHEKKQKESNKQTLLLFQNLINNDTIWNFHWKLCPYGPQIFQFKAHTFETKTCFKRIKRTKFFFVLPSFWSFYMNLTWKQSFQSSKFHGYVAEIQVLGDTVRSGDTEPYTKP